VAGPFLIAERGEARAVQDFSEASLTEAAVERCAGAKSARVRRIAESLIRHLHAFVREVELSEAEWRAGIELLTETGQRCDGLRQEFILLSDTLGVSMLVDAIAHRRPDGATQSTVLGPFYVPGAPALPPGASIAHNPAAEERRGEPTFISGRVLAADGSPIAGATLDVWQTDAEGLYDVQRPEPGPPHMRGVFRTDVAGRFRFRTVKPLAYSIPDDGPVGRMLAALGRHPFRPAHVHVIARAPGFEPLTTHLFVEGDPFLDSDAVFGVKSSLVVAFHKHAPGVAPDGTPVPVPFYTCEYDFRLVPSPAPAAS
jgi:hydroxyquinol 1,2-dioxygenase